MIDAELERFVRFARPHTTTSDVDPVYPVLSSVIDSWCRGDGDLLAVLYVAFYDLGSALTAWTATGWPRDHLPEALARQPTGVERRGLRTADRMNRHLDSARGLVDGAGSVRHWLGSAGLTWDAVRAQAGQAWGNGRWATYKLAEVMQKVRGWAITASDAGHADSTGPRQGLALLYGDDPTGNGAATVDLLDSRTEKLEALLVGEGVHASADLALVETHLCDYHAAREGRYYVGHDIDLMLRQITRPGVPENVREAVLTARLAVWGDRPELLGELSGWDGPRRDKMSEWLG